MAAASRQQQQQQQQQQNQPQQQRRRGPASARGLVVGGLACAAALLAEGAIGFVAGALRSAPPAAASNPASYGGRRALRVAAAATVTITEAKAKLMDLLDDEMLSQEVLRPEGKPTKGRLDEAIITLERLNACAEPVYDERMDGTWTVKYSGSYAPGLLSSPTRELALFLYGGGFSLGNALSSFAEGFWGQNLGVKQGEKTVRIQGGRDVDAIAEVEIMGMSRTLSYTAELMPLSAQRMSEEIVSLELPDPLGTQDLPLELRRSILVTYLDDEVMVVRDESGVPDVLVRKGGATMPVPIMEEDNTTSITSSSMDQSVDAEGDDPLSSGAA
mmetsp:Transcript_20589/g.51479  ORF Transcript_20589/g.51479 Transcript_20589/m.51479 type:complete len:330 (+) Transcript_20589:96-1085(+)